jgi:hypothetical protein
MANIIIATLDKLPERCCDCPCCKSENGTCQAIEDYRTSDWRPFWCPLKEQEGWNEYISKEDAKNALLNKGQHTTRYRLGETWELNFMEILEALDTIPCADVQPVKRGKWKKRMSTSDSIKCSVCGNNHGYETSYCPHCGARMDGETK